MKLGFGSYAAKRLISSIPLIFLIILVNFTLIQLAPGDIALIMAGENANLDNVEYIRKKYGLDQPIHVQLINYYSTILQGDLGYSYAGRRPVSTMIAERIPATLLLMITTQALSLVIGTVIGIYLSGRKDSWLDKIVGSLAYVLHSIPVFWMGLILILVFALRLRWFPVSGMFDLLNPKIGLDYVTDVLWHLILPVVTLSMWFLPIYLRVGRASGIDVSGSDYLITARSKGLKERTILFRHVLRNASLPIVTTAGFFIGYAFSGAVLTESVFGWPGMGKLIYVAIVYKDYPVIMGAFILMSITVVIATLVTDLILAKLDPRIVYK